MTKVAIEAELLNKELEIKANVLSEVGEDWAKDVYDKAFEMTDDMDDDTDYYELSNLLYSAKHELGFFKTKKESIHSKIANIHTMNDERYNSNTKSYEKF